MGETTTATAEPDTESGVDSVDMNPDPAPADGAGTIAGDADESPARRRLRRQAALLVMLVIVMALLATVFGWKLETRDEVDAASRQAMTAAQQYAVALTSIDYEHIDNDFATITNGATGNFKDMYSQSATQLKPLLVQ